MPTATTRVGLSHNIDAVISDVEDVKEDIPKEMKKRIGPAMTVLMMDAKQYVEDDSSVTGQLERAIREHEATLDQGIEFRVFADADLAPYAAIVEFGSGARTETNWMGGAQNVKPPDHYPFDFPYKSPDIQNVAAFSAFIEDWMREKGLTPEYPTMRASAVAITRTIADQGTYAHPYMRPAWFDNERRIKKAARTALKNAVR